MTLESAGAGDERALAKFSREFAPGAVLFREGEVGAEMYVIQAGYVQISKRVGTHPVADKVLATLGPGEFLGEMAILNSKPRTATATVSDEGPARVLTIDSKRFEQMIANNREITLRLIKKLSARLDSADALIEILMHKDPRARVMRGLSRHAEAFGVKTERGVRVALTAEELAAQVNAEQTVTNEVLDRLKRVRVISIESSGTILVRDLDRLFDFLEFLEMPQKFGDLGEVSESSARESRT